MTSPNVIAEMAALRDAALEDLMETSDVQLRQEAIEDGEDIDAIATGVKAVMRETAASTLRQRLSQAKAQSNSKMMEQKAPSTLPTLEQIKQIVQNLFQTDPSLGLAFRSGKKQADADWLSLYDDLVVMGAIKPEDNER
jgi:hypothetical protein